MKSGWYVNKRNPLDVVFVTDEIVRMKHPAQILFNYKDIKNNGVPKREVVGFGFRDYYEPIEDPRIYSKRLYDDALAFLVLAEAIRTNQEPLNSQPLEKVIESA